jgi:hypothetical protein
MACNIPNADSTLKCRQKSGEFDRKSSFFVGSNRKSAKAAKKRPKTVNLGENR